MQYMFGRVPGRTTDNKWGKRVDKWRLAVEGQKGQIQKFTYITRPKDSVILSDRLKQCRLNVPGDAQDFHVAVKQITSEKHEDYRISLSIY